jgi:hypothetical protein
MIRISWAATAEPYGGFENGFSVHVDSTLEFSNSGTIEGENFHGLYFYDELAGETTVATVANSGTIIGGEAGVRVQNAQLTLINSGSIGGG